MYRCIHRSRILRLDLGWKYSKVHQPLTWLRSLVIAIQSSSSGCKAVCGAGSFPAALTEDLRLHLQLVLFMTRVQKEESTEAGLNPCLCLILLVPLSKLKYRLSYHEKWMGFESNLTILQQLRLLSEVTKKVSLGVLQHCAPKKQRSSGLSSTKASIGLIVETVTEYFCSLASTELMRWSLGAPRHSNLYLSIYPAIPLAMTKQASNSLSHTSKAPFKSLSGTLNLAFSYLSPKPQKFSASSWMCLSLPDRCFLVIESICIGKDL